MEFIFFYRFLVCGAVRLYPGCGGAIGCWLFFFLRLDICFAICGCVANISFCCCGVNCFIFRFIYFFGDGCSFLAFSTSALSFIMAFSLFGKEVFCCPEVLLVVG